MGEGLITANHSRRFRFALFRGEGLSDLAAKLLEAAEASSHSPNSKKIHFGEWDCSTTQLRPRTLLLFGMQVNGCANSALENERYSGKEVPATH